MSSLIMNLNFVTVEITLVFHDRLFPSPRILHDSSVKSQQDPAKQIGKKHGQQTKSKQYTSEQKPPNLTFVNTTPSSQTSTAIQLLVMSS